MIHEVYHRARASAERQRALYAAKSCGARGATTLLPPGGGASR
jgi:hypothetical protein